MERFSKEFLLGLFVGGVIILVLGIVGNSDFKNELMIEQEYCMRVADGVHTHYNSSVDCTRWDYESSL